jgi:hypothetical protein
MMRVFRPDFPQNPQRGKFHAPNPKFQTKRVSFATYLNKKVKELQGTSGSPNTG